ncbi:MAG: glutaredoxin 3 [Microvirgula sp.]
MQPVTVYATATCPYCLRAEQLLSQKGVTDVTLIRVDLDADARQRMVAVTGRRTVPQIFVGDTHVGGYDDLAALERAGKLDLLLADA